jgi:hypothetical protein
MKRLLCILALVAFAVTAMGCPPPRRPMPPPGPGPYQPAPGPGQHQPMPPGQGPYQPGPGPFTPTGAHPLVP